MKYTESGIHSDILRAVAEMGFEDMTPIQEQAIPVLLEGKDIIGKPGNVAYMLQKDLLLPYRTIVDNVALPLMIRGMKKAEAREKASTYFAEFGKSVTTLS